MTSPTPRPSGRAAPPTFTPTDAARLTFEERLELIRYLTPCLVLHDQLRRSAIDGMCEQITILAPHRPDGLTLVTFLGIPVEHTDAVLDPVLLLAPKVTP